MLYNILEKFLKKMKLLTEKIYIKINMSRILKKQTIKYRQTDQKYFIKYQYLFHT